MGVRAKGFSRRSFLAASAAVGGGLLLATCLPFGRRLALSAEGGPPSGPFAPNLFLVIGPDDSVTLLSKHLEMGQGVVTGLATLVAEELDADWAQMRFAFAPADASLYNNLLFGPVQGTGGSTSMANSWTQMRQVGAAARHMLVAAAALRWSVPPETITVQNGVVSDNGGHSAGFGELASLAAQQAVPETVTLKPPAQWQLIGQRVSRLDSPMKTDGSAIYALDVQLPGLLTAVLARPQLFGASLLRLDDAAARAVPGVVAVVPLAAGVAVVAEDTWAALQGRAALQIDWDQSQAETRSTDQILNHYRDLAQTAGAQVTAAGDVDAALAGAVATVEAEFAFPYLAHAPMEPLNLTMQRTEAGAEIWSGCQLQTVDQMVAAQILGLQPQQVKVNTLLGGGSFGRRGSPIGDWTVELAQLLAALGGTRPVKLLWTREDDLRGGYYRPLVLHRVAAGIDAEGGIVGWQHRVVTQSIFAGTPFAAFMMKDGIDESSIEGLRELAYRPDAYRLELHSPTSPVTRLWWRSVGNSHTAHVIETMVDELATLAGQDPLAFRLAALPADARQTAVLRLAAERAGWGEPLPRGRGRGIAVHECFGTCVAMVAEVTVLSGDIRVDRVVAAVDCGIAINPDQVAAQVEGAIGFALSAVLRNQITLTAGMVDQGNFDDYEPTRMREMPQVEVHILPSENPPSGIGEPGVPPLAPAIGNAIFAASGRRLRSLPLDLGVLV
jgi:isoquinoline 1-oxidoreductase subunit beta